MVDIRNAYNILVGNPEWKRPLERPRRGWKTNIILDLREAGWEVVDWMHMAQGRGKWRALLKTVINVLVS
jgi:hypothetical protein